jgi:hypothetical protein
MLPERSVVSSTVVQKQVGQTIVQLLQARQCSATWSQRGCSGLSCSSSFSAWVSSVRPIIPRVLAAAAAASAISSLDGGRCGRISIKSAPAAAAGLHQKAVTVIIDQFGQCDVESGLDLGAGPHRSAKASAASLAAVDRNDERVLAPNLVGPIPILPAKEYPILDGDRVQLAGADADEREPLRGRVLRDDRETIAVAACLPELLDRRVKEALPGMRPRGIAEIGCIAAPFQAVTPAVLAVGPAGRKFIEVTERVVDDRAVAQGRTEHPITAVRQGVDEPLQDIPPDDNFASELGRRSLIRLDLPFSTGAFFTPEIQWSLIQVRSRSPRGRRFELLQPPREIAWPDTTAVQLTTDCASATLLTPFS